eukprot:CAMPEP_0182893172 /NCGR_PEP_ID=MMETSP0034_2-20130328/24313_1 /TAXON_ID=156128 /ORGANISM="Nephroselmis pyriformis, Strain CCMP717" /LENGTH=277 /DNA_ID=CAMNT_0025026897 /DNA_START=163 /DNA_END=992 /DNA_ORIENTATION=-
MALWLAGKLGKFGGDSNKAEEDSEAPAEVPAVEGSKSDASTAASSLRDAITGRIAQNVKLAASSVAAATSTARSGASTMYKSTGRFMGRVGREAGNLRNRLTGKHYQDYHKAVARLESATLGLSGPERGQSLKRWIAALEELAPATTPTDGCTDGWGGAGDDAAPPLPAADGPAGEKAHTVLFFDKDVSPEPMNFRGVFLRSRALENIVEAAVMTGLHDDDENDLRKLFAATLVGGEGVQERALRGVRELAAAVQALGDKVVVDDEELAGVAAAAVG